jgi:hypothetical protein
MARRQITVRYPSWGGDKMLLVAQMASQPTPLDTPATNEKAPDPGNRRLVNSKIWEGRIYSPGMERTLPAGFPMHGPHWQDCSDGTCACKG